MFIVAHRKIFYAVSVIIMAVSFYGLFTHGLKLGIDFKGGSILEVAYKVVPEVEILKEKTTALNLGDVSIRSTGETGFIIRTKELSDAERASLVSVVSIKDSGAEIKRFDSVGPVLGAELQKNSLWAIGLVILAIVLFISFAFRKVSEPISSWKYGIVAIIALLHDVIVPAGVFSFLGAIKGVEIDSLFVTALLVVLGFSIHDTIVVFDRTRENLHKNNESKDKKTFETIVSDSISQTFTRSINTSLTTIIALAVLYFVGPEATKNFSLALLIGIITGTYSSIFIASPLLVTLEKWQKKT